ncbi:MAG TPA: response regulator, partial [Pyrinomonadaceae bacterium]
MIVDDEQTIRWALSEALRSWGYQPVEAGTVAAGVSTFESESPATVLLDIDLPDGSGLDAL